ncbi:MAG: hypothetical protein L6Q52_07630 [Rhodocyclaceae bacterium]|nr:hypothetical protein [Rhodocyclaceae bacterium]
MEAITANKTEQKQTPAWLLELFGGEPEPHQKIEVAGIEWWYWNYSGEAEIHTHIEEAGGRTRMLGCSQGKEGKYCWEFSLLVSEGQYVRARGETETLLQAVQAALAYMPEEMECGGVTWFRGQEEKETWEGWVGGDYAHVDASADEDDAFRWGRKCAEAKDLLLLCRSFFSELGGEAMSREDAMQAAIDAPNKLRELVSKFVLGKPVEEAYARGVADGREEMRTAIKSTINCIRLLPSGRAKPKEAA